LVRVIANSTSFRWYLTKPRPSISASQRSSAPHVTIIRPVKGLDHYLRECLASTFQQDYPRDRLTIRFCVDSPADPAVPVLRSLLEAHPSFDARLLIETDDSVLQTANGFGPNPKIRSMSRAYREARGDVVWIVDCNVWVNKGTCGRMVDTLCGFGGGRPNKFVHQLPLVVDESRAPGLDLARAWAVAGGVFEEAWFSAAHAKFYTAINTVLIAPCIVGKSNMFRKSHLDALTGGVGIDYFSHNICEDHLIGDLLWKRPIPAGVLQAYNGRDGVSRRPWGNHALAFGDLAVQPVLNMSVAEFFARRVRWLRVRKFTVLLATLVEPGTESFLCSLYGAFALTTLPYFRDGLGIPSTWTVFFSFWLFSVSAWAAVDWVLYCHMQSGNSIENREQQPELFRFRRRRQFRHWLMAWAGRELLAFPIWAWAVYGGVTVTWRQRKFRVGVDMRVREIEAAVDSNNKKD
jgi:ceramide glucosyltransferase